MVFSTIIVKCNIKFLCNVLNLKHRKAFIQMWTSFELELNSFINNFSDGGILKMQNILAKLAKAFQKHLSVWSCFLNHHSGQIMWLLIIYLLENMYNSNLKTRSTVYKYSIRACCCGAIIHCGVIARPSYKHHKQSIMVGGFSEIWWTTMQSVFKTNYN